MNALEALARCQRAWEASQPQLFIELYPDGLDEAYGAVPLVEPARIPSHRRGQGGLTTGAEPCRDLLRTDGVPFAFPVPPVSTPPRSGGSAPLTNTTGPDAPPAKGARPAQEVTS